MIRHMALVGIGQDWPLARKRDEGFEELKPDFLSYFCLLLVSQ